MKRQRNAHRRDRRPNLPALHIRPDIAPTGFTFNHFLTDAEEPAIFHTGPRGMFPSVSEAIATLLPLEWLRWIMFGHVEADECGAMNLFLAAAPDAQVAHTALGQRRAVSQDDDRGPPDAPGDLSTHHPGQALFAAQGTQPRRRLVPRQLDAGHQCPADKGPARALALRPARRVAVGAAGELAARRDVTSAMDRTTRRRATGALTTATATVMPFGVRRGSADRGVRLARSVRPAR